MLTKSRRSLLGRDTRRFRGVCVAFPVVYTTRMSRSFLALQGTASPFFSRLADGLRERGHAVQRVNFCGGDLAYDGHSNSLNFSGYAQELPEWYANIVRSGAFTDVIMFGDCREVHRHMHPISAEVGLRVSVFEEGYVRPHWLTLEHFGVNGRSLLPRDPDWYRAHRAVTPASPPARATGYNLYERAYHDIRYRGANAFYARRFPHYHSHRPRNGLIEYAGLATRALRQRGYDAEAERVTRDLLLERSAYFLFPLQLNSDAQIAVHSPFEGVRDAIDRVIRSFASRGPDGARLVVKNHPLDTGLINYRSYALRLAEVLGVGDRLHFIDGGHLPTLLEHAKGVVVVNSTVGLSALHHHRPLVALGTAIYGIPGLTWQGDLDDFWSDATPPDMHLYRSFLDYVMHHTQINGDFYTQSGIAMATAGAIKRLEAKHD